MIQTEIHALFKLVSYDPETNTSKELTDWFPNLVLNTGLDQMSKGVHINRVCVGSGNSIPVETQARLDFFVASTSTYNSSAKASSQTVTMPYYHSSQFTFRFGQGVAAGNLSEIGLGWSNTELWNRALILDSNGNPTTITVLSNEFLDVAVEIRVYPKLTDTVMQFNLRDNKNNITSVHTATIRPNFRSTITANFFANKVRIGTSSPVSAPGTLSVYPSSSIIGDMLTNITGGATSGAASSVESQDTYPTTRSTRASFTSAITQSGEHSILLIPTTLSTYKVLIEPPIPKNNTETLKHSFVLSWDRYTNDT